MKKEKSKKLLRSVGEIGEDLTKEAEEYTPQKKSRTAFKKYGAAAALLAVAVTVGIVLAARGGKNTRSFSPITLTNGTFESSAPSTLPPEFASVSVKAENTDGKIIGTQENLIISTSGDCDTDTLLKYVNLSPETDFSVTRLGEGKFRLSPSSHGLIPDTVYRVTVGDAANPNSSYTFQTEKELCIKNILPADLAIEVPVNTGIEIRFSDSLEKADFSEFVSLSPNVDGEFSLSSDSRTLRFVPDEDLEYDSVYTVTVDKGIKGISGKVLAEGKKAKFRTETDPSSLDGDGAYLFIGESYRYDSDLIFSKGEDAYLSYYLNSGEVIKKSDGKAELYRFDSYNDAKEAILRKISSAGEKEIYDTSSLVFIGEFKAQSGYDLSDKEVYFGTDLDRGAYLVKITENAEDAHGNKTSAEYYTVMQITDIRSFTMSSDGKTVIKADHTDGTSANGAKVDITSFNYYEGWGSSDSDAKGFRKTSSVIKDGFCTVDTEDDSAAVILVEDGVNSLITAVNIAERDGESYRMSFMYTDREVYFSDDVINFSGFSLPAYGNEKLPDTLYLSVAESERLYPVTVGENGSFSGSYTVENHRESGLTLAIVDSSDNVYASKYVSITEEQKPRITASLTFDKLFYRYGETANITLSASFFDGTPAEGFDFAVTSQTFGSGESTVMKTDADGIITFSVKTGFVKAYATSPSDITVSAELCDMETQILYINASAPYFHSDYHFGVKYKNNERLLTLNNVDTSGIKSEDDLSPRVFPENTVGTPANGSVGYSLIRSEIIRTEEKRYDPILSKNFVYYNYNTVESTEETGSFDFKNGVISLPLKKADFNGSYYYKITYNDGRQTFEETVSAEPWEYPRFENDEADISLALDKEKYKVGDSFSAQLRVHGANKDTVLYAICADGIEDCVFADRINGTFDESMIPGANVFAVYYDPESDRYRYDIKQLSFDFSGSEADISVKTDKESYEPGERASAEISSKDNPGAYVILSIVDEACFALGDSDVDPCESFFNSVRSISRGSFCYPYYENSYFCDYFGAVRSSIKPFIYDSTISLSSFCGQNGYSFNYGMSAGGFFKDDGIEMSADAEYKAAEAPGENTYDGFSADSYYIRKYFADNPEFLMTQLDENGKASIEFTVPDNLTSWRITAVASDRSGTLADIAVGKCITDVICTKNFFVNPEVSATFINGDDIVASARSFGASAHGTASYNAMIKNSSGEIMSELSVKEDCGKYAWFNFGKMDEGRYTLTIFAECGKNKDAVEQEFEVIETQAACMISEDVSLEELKNLKPALYPLTLSFCDGASSDPVYIRAVNTLINARGSRNDTLAAEYIALIAGDALYGTDSEEAKAKIKDRFDNQYGNLFGIYDYSEEDAGISAEIIALCPELVRADRMRRISDTVRASLGSEYQLDETELCKYAALLASNEEPVLDILTSIASKAGDFPNEAKLWLAAGFAFIGDYSSANDVYLSVRSAIGKKDGEFNTLKFTGDSDQETERLTSLALIVSSYISKNDAKMTAKYLTENRSEHECTDISLAFFVKFFMSDNISSEKKITYRIGEEEKSITVSGMSHSFITLTKSDFEAFEIIKTDDGVSVTASYLGVPSQLTENREDNGRVSITKSYEKADNGMYKVTVTVSGTSERTDEYFDINDVIPAGARFFRSADYYDKTFGENSDNFSAYACICNTTGQKMTGYVSIHNKIYDNDRFVYKKECPEYSFSVSASYFIRAAAEGNFISESAVITGGMSDIFALSERHSVTVSSSGDWDISVLNR